ncbi:hypothetical protein [Maribacter polysaccharolyticus]|nr:hypothetical protein [Maribacter polysaccharolyticus]MDE3741192.1 hypothetical protein [Maribacter polysaccharolyticus]
MELSIIKTEIHNIQGKKDIGVKQAIPKLDMKDLILVGANSRRFFGVII